VLKLALVVAFHVAYASPTQSVKCVELLEDWICSCAQRLLQSAGFTVDVDTVAVVALVDGVVTLVDGVVAPVDGDVTSAAVDSAGTVDEEASGAELEEDSGAELEEASGAGLEEASGAELEEASGAELEEASDAGLEEASDAKLEASTVDASELGDSVPGPLSGFPHPQLTQMSEQKMIS